MHSSAGSGKLEPMGRTDTEPPGGGTFDQLGDATRRTYLANERTYLAWWRTGITSLAAGIGVGRVVPSLTHQSRWPYAILGAGFALVGIVTIAYGLRRQREVEQAVATGQYRHARQEILLALTAAGVILGLLLMLVVVIQL
jgi:putative membrane protein